MWTKILKKHIGTLSKKQSQLIETYERDHQGRAFYPMAKLLWQYSFQDEATEMMMAGVANYPDDIIARVTLVSYLWQKKLFSVAWQTLDQANHEELTANLLGLTLRFKLAILLGYDGNARRALVDLQDLSPRDDSLLELISAFSLYGVQKARECMAEELSMSSEDLEQYIGSHHLSQSHSYLPEQPHSETSFTDMSNSSQHAAESYSGFYAVPLKDLFHSSKTEDINFNDTTAELDSYTLAEIFEKQNCYKRALKIYRRLFARSPNHEGLYGKIYQLEKKLADEERSGCEDVEAVVDHLQQKQVIDKKRHLLETMLENI
ncbi:MAG: hypothetical protein OXC40_02465 [Proteobacteria bacterium]|nr:hypothetical protein [Pseudomonadota bacterium]